MATFTYASREDRSRSRIAKQRRSAKGSPSASGPLERAAVADQQEVCPSGLPSTRIDLKLLMYINRHQGRVTARQLARNLGSCRTTSDARRRLDALVAQGMGRWAYTRSGSKGGRPTRIFELTVSANLLADLRQLAKGPMVNGSVELRRITRELVAFLARYQRTRCSTLIEALDQVRRILAGLANAPGEQLLPIGRRELSLSAKGAARAAWVYP